MEKPYVGVTGPTSIEEVDSIIHAFSEANYGMETPHIPMLGYLVSLKTLNGEQISNKRYPTFGELSELIKRADNKVLTMIHYNSRERSTLADQIRDIFEGLYSNHLCRALQLNIVSPDKEQVALIKKRFPKMQIVLQASGSFMGNRTPQELSREIGSYGRSIDYVLIDPSGGRGLEFEIDKSVGIFKELNEKLPYLTIGFAGGFTHENTAGRIKDLMRKAQTSQFCIDAEGGLRDKLSNAYGDDLLNINKTKLYLKEAQKVLS